MESRNFWHLQMDKGFLDGIDDETGQKALNAIKTHQIIGTGEWDDKQCVVFKKNLKIRDIVLVRSGKNPIALVEVTSDYFHNWKVYENVRKVKVLDYYDESTESYIGQYNGMRQSTLKPVRDSENNTGKFIKSWYEMVKKNENMKSFKKLLKNTPQLILQGPPGTGKTREAKMVANWFVSSKTEKEGESTGETDNGEVKILYPDQIKIIQFHPAYNYDDFVRGLVPKPSDNGLTFEPEDKVLLEMAEKAENDKGNSYFLIIDEINRANLPAVLGELIYALEYRDEPVDSLYPKKFKDNSENNPNEESRKIILPSNLYIIGTMNTADRSVGTLDYAIRRRFVFKNMPPEPENVLNAKGYEKGYELFKNVANLFVKFKNDKWDIEENIFLSPEFNYDDVMIGHSYFLAEGDDLQNNKEYKIKPILREYAKDGILIDNGNQLMVEIEKL